MLLCSLRRGEVLFICILVRARLLTDAICSSQYGSDSGDGSCKVRVACRARTVHGKTSRDTEVTARSSRQSA
jgi:hypothetical protein